MKVAEVNLGPIKKLMEDPEVSEIMINNSQGVFAEKKGKKILTDVKFSGEEAVLKFAEDIYHAYGKRVAKDVPFADVCLEDGTRVNVIIPPLSRFGVSITFRKFAKNIKTLDDLIKNGTLTEKAAELITACIKGKVNIIFSGGTAVGKTTLLQVLSRFFAEDERIITIEDAAELKIERVDTISLETRTPDQEGKGGVSLRDLIRNSLRMAPDRIIVGEVRGEEAIDMLQAMATGHTGTIGIVHGNSPKDVVARLETMVMMSGINLPLGEVRKIIASTINVIVHVERLRDGTRKVTHITEVRGLDREEIVLNDLFGFRFERIAEDGTVIGKLKPSIKFYPLFFQKFQQMGLLSDNVFVNE